MSLKVYNVLNRKKEIFTTQEPMKVKMYACGITASGEAHIGHALQACVFDMIKKYLEYSGYQVTYVRNYTDVDDKIIAKANQLKIDPIDYAKKIMIQTDKELAELGVDKPTIQSRATDCIADIIDLIKRLEEKGYAYQNEDSDVFFRVSAFPRYGNFSNRLNDEGLHGVRIDVDEKKIDDRDFVLWKSAKDGEISWDSPWGKGRPGWHIECSAMSMKYLGETLDIHGGGKDLIFPHHENEIAQSEAATGKQFSRFWIHNGLIKINGQKMSKSFGNSIFLRDILNQFNRDVIRVTLHQNSYRSDLNITDGIFEQYEKKIYNMYKYFSVIEKEQLKENIKYNQTSIVSVDMVNKFESAMDNDFNTAVAVADLFEYISTLRKCISEKKYQDAVDIMYTIKKLYYVMGIAQQNAEDVILQIKEKYLSINNITEGQIISLLEERKKLKEQKDYISADNIKNELAMKNIEIKDGRDNTVEWDFNIV